MRIIDALLWGEQELKTAQVENPRWDADLLLGHILHQRREQLYLERERLLKAEELDLYQDFIKRRSQREPLQYIVKHQEFMGLDFYVDERVLIPRADSEVLIERVLEYRKSWSTKIELQGLGPQEVGPRIVDLCTGSGALAISIAHYWPEAQVTGTDISSDALQVAQYNSQNLGVNIFWRQGDFLEPIRGETWDIIISNPPYIGRDEYPILSPEVKKEPAIALLAEEDGLAFYHKLALEARSLLNPQGCIFLEIGWQQGEKVSGFFREQGFQVDIYQDYGNRDRVLWVR
ncbi:MAG: peptide chain release factor N(5)-glutamine methyltransferase [Desulfitobacterium sp.]|nr:peptide chain release factor N(5)-glutamine methyltransferase [Desulfitobacterium sp.]